MHVSGVIDGDTLDTPEGRVRLFGVDTPERGERCYSQAASALRQLAGRAVRVEHGPRSVDPGGRLLFYVFTEGGNSIDEILVEQGAGPSLEQGRPAPRPAGRPGARSQAERRRMPVVKRKRPPVETLG